MKKSTADTALPSLPPVDPVRAALPGVARGFLSRLCFDRGDYELLRIVDDVLSRRQSSGLRQLLVPYLHPHGIKEMAAPRALRIAYATIHLLGSLEAGLAGDRLSALRALRDEVMATPESGLEKNTARVLLEIMKQLVRLGDNPRRRLELAHDFRAAVPGKPRVVRRLLAEHHLLEMPEAWNQLAFDDHVHDANTKGRKTPTHLILDAWIKGIRRLTVVHYHFVSPETAAELLAAGAIMDMEVDIAIECLARHDGKMVKILWTPLGLTEPGEFEAFLDAPAVAAFMQEGQALSLRWRQYALELLAAFNERHAPALTARFDLDIPPLDPQDFLRFVGSGQASRLHLARFIHARLQAHLDAQTTQPREHGSGKGQVNTLLAERDALDVEALLTGCLSAAANPEIPLPEQARPGETLPPRLTVDPAGLVARLSGLHCQNRLTLVTAEMDLSDVLLVLFACGGAITHLDIFNLRVFETAGGDAGETLELLSILNTGNVVALKRLLNHTADTLEATGSNPAKVARLRALRQEVATLAAACRRQPLGARIGTDSVGLSTRTHGMGLVVADTLPARARRHLAKRAKNPRESLRRSIPVGLAVSPALRALPDDKLPGRWTRGWRRLGELPGLRLYGYRWKLSWVVRRAYKATPATANIHTLGGMEPRASEQYLTDAADAATPLRLSPRRMNGSLKNALKIGIGFAVAAVSFATTHSWWVLAWGGPFIWFGITGLRNVIQATLGGSGLRGSPLLRWKDYISIDRIADSLFFTGFSVPLLDIVVRSLLLGRGCGITTATNPTALFAIMALANGLYLASHNLFRGLPKSAAIGNLFRTVLSIPLALAINQTAAWLLTRAGAPDPAALLDPFAAIVSKFASDCVAAVIEGLADRGRYRHMRFRDYREKFKQLFDAYAQLELLYPGEDVRSLLESPKRLLSELPAKQQGLAAILIVNALDFLYFWMYQPHARAVLARAVRSMSLEERRVFLLSQYVLLREKEISRLFIDGLVGRAFAPALAFYLSQARRYLDDIQALAHRYPPAATLSLENMLLGRRESNTDR